MILQTNDPFIWCTSWRIHLRQLVSGSEGHGVQLIILNGELLLDHCTDLWWHYHYLSWLGRVAIFLQGSPTKLVTSTNPTVVSIGQDVAMLGIWTL